MESIPPPPQISDGILFVLSTAQLEHAQRKNVAGMPLQRLPLLRAATAGQPVFLFDQEARTLHGPYAAVGPGATNVDATSSTLPAQLRFNPVVRSFSPLPEEAISDLLTFEPGIEKRPSPRVDGAVVTELLLLFVLRHHGLYVADGVSQGGYDEANRAAAVKLATFLEQRKSRTIAGPSLGEFYATFSSAAEGEACRAIVRNAATGGCKKGLQSFVHMNRDLLCLVGEKLSLGVGLAGE